jgi:hypothetical protein
MHNYKFCARNSSYDKPDSQHGAVRTGRRPAEIPGRLEQSLREHKDLLAAALKQLAKEGS